MSILAKLCVEDEKPLNVIESYFKIKTPTDEAHLPIGLPVPKTITLIIEASKENFLWEWATETLQKRQVELKYYPVLLNGSTRTLYLSDVYLVSYKFNFISTGKTPSTITLELACGGIEDSNSDGKYSAHWRKTYPMPANVPVTTLNREYETVKNPDIVSCRYTDEDGNTIDELYEDTVILEVKTKDCIGKTVDIDLSDDDFNFKYNGKVLKDDQLKRLKITANIQKVELEVVDEDDE